MSIDIESPYSPILEQNKRPINKCKVVVRDHNKLFMFIIFCFVFEEEKEKCFYLMSKKLLFAIFF